MGKIRTKYYRSVKEKMETMREVNFKFNNQSNFILNRTSIPLILFACLLTLMIDSCTDPGYSCSYRIKNETTSNIQYTLYWRQVELQQIVDSISINEETEISSEGGIGRANNDFRVWAESLFVNDSNRLITCDTAMFKTISESSSQGVYTLVLTDSLIEKHKELLSSNGNQIYDCTSDYWKK